jgi:exonuclease SbcD
VVEVPSRDGSEAAIVACVPFVPERRFASETSLFESTEAWFQSYAEGMGQLMAAMAAAFRSDRVNVVMAHLFTDGALVGRGGGERELTIGMAYAVPPGRLPGTAAYCALGHVHKPQAVRGSAAPARYAGSLLQLDFGESEQGKSVAVVDASPGKPAKVREVALTAGRPLLDLRGTMDQVIARSATTGDAHLRVFLEVDGPMPGVADRVREEIPGAVDVQLVYERRDLTAEGEPLSSLAPREQFASYYRDQHGAEPADELMQAFDEVLALETEEA